MKCKKTLGIVGGMGAYAGEFFFRLVTERTLAKKDSDHLDVIVSSLSSTPDRTQYIVGASCENPVYHIQKSIDNLEKCGAEVIAIPCNTAMVYFDRFRMSDELEVLNIIYQAVNVVNHLKASNVGILATDGTIRSKLYQNECERNGISAVIPNDDEQHVIMHCIYDKLKLGNTKVNKIYQVFNSMLERCDLLILGCTELSMIDLSLYKNRDYIIDSSKALAKAAILSCNAIPCGFEPIYD